MKKTKLICVTFLTMCLAIFSGLIGQQAAMAQSEDEAPPREGEIQLTTKYPVLAGPADKSFEFEVSLSYKGGSEPRDFDLSVTAPTGWITAIQESTYEKTEIARMHLNPVEFSPKSVVVVAMAPYWLYPEPGDYTITFEVVEATSGKPSSSLDLTAKITARYGFSAQSNLEGGRLNIKTKAGDEGYLPITITNSGTAALDKITFSSSRPEGWSITFKPDKIEALPPGDKQEIEVAIKPPSNTIAGDYMVTLKFDSDPAPSTTPPELDIRVTVATPTKWGWIGVGIIIAVIAGLAVTFTRLGRR
ncbi:MAG: NEW3 domain-containing protein [Chloroflexota bacterium]|nr:NEW3 domain-containing protein [Chloroflexota bacterium]